MLINKYLQSLGYIFVKNVNSKYLKSLIDLGLKPIFIKEADGDRFVEACVASIQYPTIKEYINAINYYYKLSCCQISDIKTILFHIKRIINNYKNDETIPVLIDIHFLNYKIENPIKKI